MKFVCSVAAIFTIFAASLPLGAQAPSYGSNASAGHYLIVSDTKLYYEVYGSGPPVLLLHGGLYGYISGFSNYIPRLSKRFTVIAPATRGHGRSEVGSEPYSYQLFARDTAAVLKTVSDQPAVVIGFSDGAITALALAADHPELVRRAVVIGGGLGASGLTPAGLEFAKNLTPENFARDNARFIASCKALMPDPGRWSEFINKLHDLYVRPVFITPEAVRNIRCPVLLIGGDHDEYFQLKHFKEIQALIPNAELDIIPNCGHVQSLQRPVVLDQFVLPFVGE